MQKIKIWNEQISDDQLDKICGYLERGEIAIIPTDTLYAICCDALNSKAKDRICRLKKINPEKNNLSIICSDISMASEYSRIENKAYKILKEYTPGAFTFLLKASTSLPKVFKGRKMVGIRIPDNNIARQIAERLGHPLLSTSITFMEDDYAINPDLIAEEYEDKVDLMIEGEEGITMPSTIIDMTGDSPDIIRKGKGEYYGI